MPGQSHGAQLILFPGEQKLGFVGVNLRIGSWLLSSAARRRSFWMPLFSSSRAARTRGLVKVRAHVTRGYDPLHIVVGGQEQFRMIRLHGFIAPQNIRMFQ